MMRGIVNFFGSVGNGLMALFLKIILVMIFLLALIAIPVFMIMYWPFTIPFIIGLLFSEKMYRTMNRQLKLRLPKYFYINFQDFLQTLREGDEQLSLTKQDLENKKAKALKEAVDMEEALESIEQHLSHIKVKRDLKTLFKPSVKDISPRAAKALEMELDKPRWTEAIDKASRQTNGEWKEFLA